MSPANHNNTITKNSQQTRSNVSSFSTPQGFPRSGRENRVNHSSRAFVNTIASSDDIEVSRTSVNGSSGTEVQRTLICHQSSNTNHPTLTPSGESLLATANLLIYDANGNPITTRAVLDSGSTLSIITDSLMKRLKLTPVIKNISLNGINETAMVSNKLVNITLHSLVKNFQINITCSVLKRITQKLPQFPLRKENIHLPPHITLADPEFFNPADVDLLLGADVYYSLMTGDLIKLQDGFLALMGTHLGYVIGGPVPMQALPTNKDNTCLFLQTSTTDSLLQRFWEVESCPPSSIILKPDEIQAEKHFNNTLKILSNGSFQVDLPLKSSSDHLKLGDSYTMAKKRFLNLENRFYKKPKLAKDYKLFIDEYLALGHAKVVPFSLKNIYNENKYFLPHHCVIRESNATTKLRVVFDASAKSSSGISLNDIMLKGFTVQPELMDILCRFRIFKFVLTADVQKMYRQILVNPSHTFLQTILWRDNPNEELKMIELQTVTYGTNSAPYLATRSLKELALKNRDKYPLAAETLLSQTYVDDILSGSDCLQQLQELYVQLNSLLQLANFKLHKWGSNNEDFLNAISGKTSQAAYHIQSETNSSKVLGILWDPKLDQFSITLPKQFNKNFTTKRDVLSQIAQMFDPLGLIGPIIVLAKCLMQCIWQSGIDWDDHLPEDILNQWSFFMNDIQNLSLLKIPRCLFDTSQVVTLEMHGFCDASMKAYGACVYLRAIYSDGTTSCNLVTAKSRISPLKTITLPRLELCGAVLLAQLVTKIVSVYELKISISSVNLWSDSKITLCWLKTHPSKWSIFVSHRVAEIQTLTSNFHWRYVPSKENPADCLSRGMLSNEIINSSLWWHGPHFLLNPNVNLDQFDTQPNIKNLPEERKSKPALIINAKDIPNFWNSLFDRFSTFSRLQRVVGFCLRFINNLRQHQIRNRGPLKVEELQQSSLIIVKSLQKISFSRELKELQSIKTISNRSLLHLTPFIDEVGLLRVGGRLAYSQLPYDQKHPIILPSKNIVTKLIIKLEHSRLGHAGAHSVLSSVRLMYWPLNGLSEVKKVIRECFRCHRFRAQAGQQLMSDLPIERIKPSRPFTHTGVDFGGPFFLKSSNLKRASIIKSYIAIFVCMATKAVHIEAVSSLSTDSFILTLKRFISRRGCPNAIFSDNATNFFGSSNQLKELYNFFKVKNNTDIIETFLSTKEISWKFIPPRSPHWGGLWEAAVKSAKHHLVRIAGNSKFTFEEFSTVLSQVEAILNSRPLTPLSTDSNDLTCLTPGHFLIGESLTSFPERDLTNVPENRLSRYKRCVQVQQHFWKRWSREYLNQLQQRPKWMTPSNEFKVGGIVLVKEDNLHPLQWPLAKILEVVPSKDSKVRAVKLKTKTGTFVRNITKLCLLPNDSSE